MVFCEKVWLAEVPVEEIPITEAAVVVPVPPAEVRFRIVLPVSVAAGAFVLGIISSYLGYSMLYIICGIIVVITIPVYKQLSSRKRKNERIVGSQREGASSL